MKARFFALCKIVGLLVIGCFAALLGHRIYTSLQGPPLEPWHTFVPNELSVDQLDATDWQGYLDAEAEIFNDVTREVVQHLPPHDRIPQNRYFAESPVHPGKFAQDWNRSYELVPEGKPQGAVVLLHGLTEAPYSLRHIARYYQSRGFVAVGLRTPGHGTVPAALTTSDWEEWIAATRLAVREARSKAGPAVPLHIVGFSNGGAMGLKYTLDTLEDSTLPKPDRLILISPMLGITAFARFAGLAALPAIYPAFVKAAWLVILPEFIPFKYNSFPVNAAVQTHNLTQALQSELADLSRQNKLQELPPILTFQSIVDHTVSTRAVITALYGQLPMGPHELVLFDINRTSKFGPLLAEASDTAVARLLPPAPRNYRTTIVANISPSSAEVAEFRTEAGDTKVNVRKLGLFYPKENFSLSHVALPIPPEDALYGAHPTDTESFGVNLGALASRGETGVLIVALDSLLRVSSNPFFPYLMERIGEGIENTP